MIFPPLVDLVVVAAALVEVVVSLADRAMVVFVAVVVVFFIGSVGVVVSLAVGAAVVVAVVTVVTG